MLLFSAIRGGNTVSSITAPTLGTPTMTSTTASITFSGGSGYTTLIPQYSTDNSNWTSISSDTSSPIDVTGLTSSTLYYFRALADNNVSYASNTVTGTTSASSSTPTPSDPNATTDTWFDSTAGVDGTGTQASPYNNLTSARWVAAGTAGKQIVIKGTFAQPDATGASSGTSGSRVVVRGWPSSSGTLTYTGNGARIGGGSYWWFHDLTLTVENNGICLEEKYDFSGGVASTYFRMTNCTCSRTSNSLTDNSGIVFATSGSAIGFEAYLCTFEGTAGASNNQSGIWLDYAVGINIVGCLINNFANPIYFKHTDVNSSSSPGGTVKNCIIRNAGSGRGFQASLNWVTYENCAFDSCDFGMDESGGGLSGGNNCTINHCTFLNSNIYWNIHDTNTKGEENNTFTNNALLGTSSVYDNSGGLSLNGSGSNYDQNNTCNYTAVSGTSTVRYRRNGNTYNTPALYHAAFADQEANGVAGTITLVGGSTPGSTAANWAMSAGVGINAANDGTDCGVDASKLLTAA